MTITQIMNDIFTGILEMKCSIPDTSFQLIFIHTPDSFHPFPFLRPSKEKHSLAPMTVYSWQNSSITE